MPSASWLSPIRDSTRDDFQFLSAAVAVTVLGCLGVAVVAVATSGDAAFAGSVGLSGVVGLVFAGQHARRFRWDGRPHLPGALVRTVFGGWFVRGIGVSAAPQRLETVDETIRRFTHVGGLVGGGLMVVVGLAVVAVGPVR